MTTIFNDGVLEAVLYPNNWVFVRWIQNERGRLQKSLIRDLARLETAILRMNLCGWFTWSELHHEQFHKLLQKFGAVPTEIKDGLLYFVKPIASEGDLHVRLTP